MTSMLVTKTEQKHISLLMMFQSTIHSGVPQVPIRAKLAVIFSCAPLKKKREIKKARKRKETSIMLHSFLYCLKVKYVKMFQRGYISFTRCLELICTYVQLFQDSNLTKNQFISTLSTTQKKCMITNI